MPTIISAKNMKKIYGDKLIFSNLSFDIEEGDFVALFGPNGCGKSTILNILSEVTEKDGGKVLVKNKNKREWSHVFQNVQDSLFPWISSYQNMVFPLEIQKRTKEEIFSNVEQVKEIVGEGIDLKKYPYQLSGGQQQMLALMRALVTQPRVLFIDEPFSALDYENNLKFRNYMQQYYLKQKPTILMVTHDIEEAVHVASKIIVLSKNPTRIIDIIKCNEVYPRSISYLKSERFQKYKEQVLSAFERGINL